jgi:hypothetical protein
MKKERNVMPSYGGIDVGRGHFFACAMNASERSVSFPEGELSLVETLVWLDDNNVQTVCIDAPPRPNQQLLGRRLPANADINHNRRVGEFQLGIGGCYGTPQARPDPSDSNGWMASGMDLFSALEERKHWSIDLGSGTGELFETHPTYGFKALLGFRDGELVGDVQRHVTDPERLLRPKRPRNRGGHQQRIELLSRALQDVGIELTDDLLERWETSIDFVDATFCALLAYWRATGWSGIRPIGAPQEGSIYLYVPQPTWTVTRHDAMVRPATTAPRPRRAALNPPPNAVILRLGENGPGGMSQQDTIELALLAFGEGECWIPIGTNHQFKLAEQLLVVDNTLFLAFGDVLRLRVTAGNSVFRPHHQFPYPGEANPWEIDHAQGWVEGIALEEVNLRTFQTVHQGEWGNGFTDRGANLLRARVTE